MSTVGTKVTVCQRVLRGWQGEWTQQLEKQRTKQPAVPDKSETPASLSGWWCECLTRRSSTPWCEQLLVRASLPSVPAVPLPSFLHFDTVTCAVWMCQIHVCDATVTSAPWSMPQATRNLTHLLIPHHHVEMLAECKTQQVRRKDESLSKYVRRLTHFGLSNHGITELVSSAAQPPHHRRPYKGIFLCSFAPSAPISLLHPRAENIARTHSCGNTDLCVHRTE